MKILKLRFANLNSIAGEWAIDFTVAAYQEDGIFAITGPTGAGKSTILDAICLGLYGCTPRLDAITEGANEIMSRGRGECFAEVVFSTTQGCFLARWSQRRAHKKTKGKLQPPVHQLSEWPSGTLREERSSRVQPLVASLTGLDFKRFTRSMLLAQGGFAAFLQAKPDERAPLLEQLTGTEVYSTVSRAVHRLRNEAQTQINGIQAQLGELRPLPADARQQLEHLLQERQSTLVALSQEMEQQRRNLNDQIRLKEIQTQHETSVATVERMNERHRSFEVTRNRLRRAEAASHIVPLLHQLNKHQVQTESLTLRLNETRSEIDRVAERRSLQFRELTELRKRLEELTSEHERLKPKFNTARAIEQRVEHENTQLRVAEDELHAAHTQADMSARACHELERQLDGAEKQLSEKLDTLARCASDEALVGELKRIEERFLHLKRCNAAHARSLEAFQTHSRRLRHAAEAAEAESTDIQKKDAALLKIKEEQDHLAAEWELFSAGLSQATLRSETLQRASDHAALSELERNLDLWHEASESLCALSEETAQTQQQMAEATAAAQSARQTVDLLAAKVALLEEQQSLVHSVSTLSALRAGLCTGEPCPLCGSREHPYASQPAAQSHLPSPDESAHALSQGRRELRTAQEELGEMHNRLTQMRSQLEHRAASKALARSRLDQLRTTAVTQASHLLQMQADASVPTDRTAGGQPFRTATDGDLMTTLRSALHRRREMLQEAEQKTAERLQQLQKMEERLRTLKDKTDVANHARAQAQSKHEATRVLLNEAERAAARAEGELQGALNEAQAAQHALIDVCAPWCTHKLLSEAVATDLDTIFEGLKRRAQNWQILKTGADEQAAKCRELRAQLQSASEHSTRASAQAERQKVTLASKAEQIQRLNDELQSLLAGSGFSSAAQAEESHVRSIEVTRVACERSATSLHETEKNVARLHEAAALAESQLISQRNETAQLQRGVMEACTQRGFSSTQDVAAAALDTDKLEGLQSEEKQLDQHMIQSRALFESSQRLLEQQLSAVQGLPDEASLAQSLKQLMEAEQKCLEEIGRIKAELAAQEQIICRTSELGQELKKTQSRLHELSILHDLIGSSDGKKFRNFAQTLTLRLMLGHANMQLQKMSDRYLLVPDEQRVLELAVVDRYQADETRSVRNLSGGESFIISLALALGLSQMASENVRVESLFLDEGFGTLDPEALDVALDALSQLRMTGKQIGVISHVDALKERLSLKISVSPAGGGRSVVVGPGCSRLDAV